MGYDFNKTSNRFGVEAIIITGEMVKVSFVGVRRVLKGSKFPGFFMNSTMTYSMYITYRLAVYVNIHYLR